MAEHVATGRPERLTGPAAFRPGLPSRLLGLGSVFGKSLRDARFTALVVGLLLGGVVLATASQLALEFDTLEARRGLAAQMDMLPALFHGLLGNPVNIDTLPGFVSWRAIGVLPILLSIWSIVALSGTLAGEAARGTLELVLSTPVSRARLALQKYAAHVVALGVALLIAALLAWLSSLAFATLPGDEMSIVDALAEFAYLGVLSLLFGSLAFALGPLLGRGIAAGTAAGVMFGSYLVNGYAEMVPGFDTLRALSPFYWTSGHRPMAGISDWPAIGLALSGAAILAAAGVWLFRRRDLAASINLPARRRSGGAPTRLFGWGLAGAGRRALAERLPSALAWGLGIGAYGFFVAVSADEFAAVLAAIPQLGEIMQRFYPGVDYTQAGGILQLAMFGFAALLAGLAAATLVSGWADDETERRLELVLAAPLERTAWALRSGAALLAAVLVMTCGIAAGTGLGVAALGQSVAEPAAGTLMLGLYAAALTGVGLAVAGLGWPRFAGGAVGGLAIGWYMLDFIGSAVGLPEWLLDLALVRHLGQPMVGTYDAVGVAACLVLAGGGLLLGALAFRRRDLRN